MAAKLGLSTLLSFSCLSLVPNLSSAAIILGQVDNFQDGTTQNWTNGAAPNPVNVATGGPDGGGDRYLEIQSGSFGGGGNLVSFNRAQWTGNYIAAGVNEVTMDLENLGTVPLSIRIAMRSGTLQGTPGYASTTAFAISADGSWHHATFLIDSADLTGINSPTPLSTFLTSVAELRILNSASPALVGDSISGQVGVDNIQATRAPAVPETSSIFAAIAGIACLSGFLRSARAKSKS
ncbi:MAG TPA: hypothetical protein VG056_07150 [Pirellulales bacterium]|nr:hypothetical protein [Pirellulales bacterium]